MAGLLCVVFQNQFFIQLHLFKEHCGTYNFIRTRNCNNSRYVHITYDGETVLSMTSVVNFQVQVSTECRYYSKNYLTSKARKI